MDKTRISPYIEPRRRLVQWLRTCLIGPGFVHNVEPENDILTEITPTRLYPTGILFPITPDEGGLDQASDPEEEDDCDGGSVTENEAQHSNGREVKPTGKTRRYIPPSAVGFSFFASREVEFHVSAWGVCYKKRLSIKNQWARQPITFYNDKTSFPFKFPGEFRRVESRQPIWPDVNDIPRAEIFILWRPYDSGWLITVSLCNRQQVCKANEIPSREEFSKRQEEMALFEVELECEIFSGEVYPYPHKDPSLLDDEERELDLQYRHKKIFAIGHGAAVDWKLKQGRVSRLRTEFLPIVEVPLVTPENETIDPQTLSLDFLCQADTDPAVFTALDAFVLAYTQWWRVQQNTVDPLMGEEKGAGERIVGRIGTARDRMARGVDLLRQRPEVARTFALTNQAMLRQWVQYDKQSHPATSRTYRWRPFQLGFLLLTIESVVNLDSPERDIVDLIWFPTGGGKTEAYLALIAFQIIWRRMRFTSSGGGTAVIMRYTLRLLTQQQFERAGRLVCALEILRRNCPEQLGPEPITAGLWVGEATTPNTFKDALTVIGNASTKTAPRRFVFTRCPWCGDSLWKTEDEKVRHGFKATDTSFRIHCLNERCDFGGYESGFLPLNVVDEALYISPPTLLFATVDKLARLVWDHRAVAFFGRDACRPPELIIQDELHLIAGALGSIVGIYEAALDTVIIQRGLYPKYVASTATIRNAQNQIEKLYGRAHAVFPPPGISAEDAFFTRALPLDQHPGRMYLGYLSSLPKKDAGFAVLSSALLSAREETLNSPELEDAWRTMIVYHGSLRGVGDSHNALTYRVKDYLKIQCQRIFGANRKKKKSKLAEKRSDGLRIAQLTSIYSPEENARTFERLACPVGDDRYLDAVLATNMISVGLDVNRLALMIVNGQPLTTAEYIQASSRVGRSDVPGLVVANYYRWQARSLSHYENFRPYHESFYRFVEPTSVTPFTPQVRRRALHAALVIVMRHSVDYLNENDAADAFDPSQQIILKAIDLLKRRCRQADSGQAAQTADQLDVLADDWSRFVAECQKSERKLVYRRNRDDRTADALLYAYEDLHQGKWATLNSMRNVEDSGLLRISKPFAPPKAPYYG